MNRQDLQILSKIRIRESKSLLDAGHYAGSYYLAGYALECAIKSAIAKRTRRYDFPNKKLANESYSHNLQALLKVAGLWVRLDTEMSANTALNDNWSVAKDWDESARYDLKITDVDARDLYSACAAKNNGLLTWLRANW